MSSNFYPRAFVTLEVPVYGDSFSKDVESKGTNTVQVDFVPRKIHLERNDHNHADTCSITADWNDVGVDPRFLSNATATVWIGNQTDSGPLTLTAQNLRFIGVAVEVSRDAQEDGGQVVEMKFHDYTNFFLRMKPYPSDGYPDYSMTLREAWNKICDNVGFFNHDTQSIESSVTQLKDKISFVGISEFDFKLSKALPERFVKFGAKIQGNVGSEDAWSVWMRCVNSVGLISFFRINKDRGEVELVVTTTTDYYTLGDEPFLVWGKNLSSMRETRNTDFSGNRGIMLRSFNPQTQTTVEAIYPPLQDATIKKKKTNARAKHPKPPEANEDSSYDVFDYPSGIATQEALDALAKRAYEERSRQELEGTARTSDMMLQRRSDVEDYNKFFQTASFDILNLSAGDVIRVDFDQSDLLNIGRDSTWGVGDAQRINYLVSKGYNPGIATLICKNMDAFRNLRNVYHVRKVDCDWAEDDFVVNVTYINRIQTDGSTDNADESTAKQDGAPQTGVSTAAPSAPSPPTPPAPPAQPAVDTPSLSVSTAAPSPPGP
jgi:hypothetical protein